MAAIINSVPDPDMVVKPLVTAANNIVNRRRVKIPANAAGTYSHVANTFGGQSTIQFDIMDSECFLDMRSLVMNAVFYPLFYKYITTGTPTDFVGGGVTTAVGYAPGCGPRLDQSASALIGRLRVGNSQGMIIEDIFQYGMMNNAFDLHSRTMQDEQFRVQDQGEFFINPLSGSKPNVDPTSILYPGSSNSTYLTDMSRITNAATNSVTAVRDLTLNFNGSSFLNSMRYLPLFLLKNGLRIEFEFENPLFAFYHAHGWPTPQYLGLVNSTAITTVAAGTWTPAVNVNGAGPSSASPGDVILGFLNGKLVASGRVLSNTVTTFVTGTVAVIYGTVAIGGYANIAAAAAAMDCLYVVKAAGSYSGTLPDGMNVCSSALSQQAAGGPYWNYSVKNPELLLDLIKPSSDVFQEYLNRFQMPEGIPYAFNRVLYINRTLTYSNATVAQIPLNLAVRSLKGLVIVITDPLSTNAGTGSTIYNFPSKSAFMLRGLTEANVQVGAQSFPVYKLNMKYGVALNQIAENNAMFETSMTNKVTVRELSRYAQNYQLCAGLVKEDGSIPVTGDSTFLASCSTDYLDTRSAVLGISTMKKDGDFVSGVDTSQAGSVVLNLTFDQTSYPSGSGGASRDLSIHIFAVADAVFTIQKDSNGVRY